MRKQQKASNLHVTKGPWEPSGKGPVCQYQSSRRPEFTPWVGKIPGRRARQPAPVFLPGKSHGQRSLKAYSPWSR